MPEAPVFSSIDAGVTSPPIVDTQQEMLEILQDITTRINDSFEYIKRCFGACYVLNQIHNISIFNGVVGDTSIVFPE